LLAAFLSLHTKSHKQFKTFTDRHDIAKHFLIARGNRKRQFAESLRNGEREGTSRYFRDHRQCIIIIQVGIVRHMKWTLHFDDFEVAIHGKLKLPKFV